MSDNTKTCEFCAYKWVSRVATPLSCPRCKRRFDYKDAREILEQSGYKWR